MLRFTVPLNWQLKIASNSRPRILVHWLEHLIGIMYVLRVPACHQPAFQHVPSSSLLLVVSKCQVWWEVVQGASDFLGIWGFKRQNPLVKLNPVETFTCFSNEEGEKKTIAQGYIQLKPQLWKPMTLQAVSLEKLNHNFREWDSHLFPLPSIIKLCSFQWLQCAAKTENHCFKIRAPI